MRKMNKNTYDRLFSIYLTPKAFKEITQKGDHFSKIVGSAQRIPKKKNSQPVSKGLNQSVDGT